MPHVATPDGKTVEVTQDALIRALLAIKSDQLPNTGNMTPELLCDETGLLNALRKWAEGKEKLFRSVFDAKLPPKTESIKGERYEASISRFMQARFSTEIAIERGYLTKDQVEECKIPAVVQQVRFKERE